MDQPNKLLHSIIILITKTWIFCSLLIEKKLNFAKLFWKKLFLVLSIFKYGFLKNVIKGKKLEAKQCLKS